MRRPARFLAVLRGALLGAALAAGAVPAAAQATLRWDAAPLEEVLVEFAEAAGVDLVFAHRLVEGRRISATWTRGDDPAGALAKLLVGTGLRAERIRPGQFVVIAEPPNVAVEPGDPAAYTGTLEGRIVDADSGAPLPGAHAFLVDLALGGVAGADGAFEVRGLPTGEYAVRFSHVGYRPVRVTLAVYPEAPTLPATIRLRPEPVQLGGATVRPRPDPSAGSGATDLPPSASPVTVRQAAALPGDPGGGDLLRALDWLPGVGRAAGAGGGLVVRGADPALVRTYRDGVPVLEAAHAAGLTGTFQPEALRAIRLHRGTPPVELGGGLAGVLEVEPRDGRGEAVAGVLALGPLAARGVVAVPLGARAGLAVAARHSALGWPFRGWPAAPALHAADGALVLDPLGGALRQGDDGTAAAYAFGDAEATFTWGPTTRQRLTVGGWAAADGLDADGDLDVRGRWRTGLASARYRVLGRRTFLTATLYATAHAARERAADTSGARRYEATLAEAGLRLDADQFVSLAHTLRLGATVAGRRLDAALDVDGAEARADERAVELAAWAQDVWRPAPGWQVEAGLRAEAFGEHLRFSPRVLARWAAQPERLYLRAGLGRQTQGLHRLPDGFSIPARASARWLLAGAEAAPAGAWQGGVGAEWAPLLGLALSADLYARRSSGTFEPRPGAPGAPDAVAPADVRARYAPAAGRAAGLELAARAEGGPWVIGLSYALARAETRTPPAEEGGARGPWRPARYDRPHALGLLLQRAGPRWSVAARLDVLAGTPAPGGGRTEPITRLEVALGYRCEALGAQWDLGARAQPTAARGAPPVALTGLPGPAPLALAVDGATLPPWPVVSLRVAW